MATEWVRVKEKATGHEVTLAKSAVNKNKHDILRKDAVGRNGAPLPPKYNRPLESLGEKPNDGQPQDVAAAQGADKKKEESK